MPRFCPSFKNIKRCSIFVRAQFTTFAIHYFSPKMTYAIRTAVACATILSLVTILTCIVFTPMIMNEVNSIWDELDTEMVEFRVCCILSANNSPIVNFRRSRQMRGTRSRQSPHHQTPNVNVVNRRMTRWQHPLHHMVQVRQTHQSSIQHQVSYLVHSHRSHQAVNHRSHLSHQLHQLKAHHRAIAVS